MICHNPPQPDICRQCKTQHTVWNPLLAIKQQNNQPTWQRSLPCEFEGELISISVNDDKQNIHYCAHPLAPSNRCSRSTDTDVQSCRTCPSQYYTPRTAGLEWISTSRLASDSILLANMLPDSTTAIASMSRSGMIPAAIIASVMHVPLCEVTSYGHIIQTKNNQCERTVDLNNYNPANINNIVIIDDITITEEAVSKIKQSVEKLKYRNTYTFASVYCMKGKTAYIDYVARPILVTPIPEWNIFNSYDINGANRSTLWKDGAMVSIDGILCHDQHSGGKPGTVYLKPRNIKLKAICSERLESNRQSIEGILLSLGIGYDKLILRPDSCSSSTSDIAKYKAEHFRNSGCGVFIESCPEQAMLINTITNRPVACPRANRVFL